MDPEEIARKELEKMEKKKRKHEKKLLKSQSRNLHSPSGLSVNSSTQSSDSDGGGGLSPDPPDGCKGSSGGGGGGCDLTASAFYPSRGGGGLGCSARCAPKDSSPSGAECAAAGAAPSSTAARGAPGLPKLNPFSVESLLSDSPPRRKAALDFPQALAPCAPTARTLIGKGHFLLYPITQPLGFIVPQAALKSPPGQEPLQRGSPLPAANPSPDPAPPKSSSTAAISAPAGRLESSAAPSPSAAAAPGSSAAASPSPYCDSSSSSSSQADSSSSSGGGPLAQPKSPLLRAKDAGPVRDNANCGADADCPAEASSLDCEEVDMD